MDELSWGWIAFAALIGWLVGIGTGIKHQKKQYDRAALAGMKGVAREILQQAMSQGHAGVVRVYKDGEVLVEESDIPTEGPPKH